MGPIEAKIRQKIEDALQPTFLEIVNDSAGHSSHGGVREFFEKMGEGYDGPAESHFSIRIVCDKFNGVSRLNRQRMVLEILAEEMKIVHALAIKAQTQTDVA